MGKLRSVAYLVLFILPVSAQTLTVSPSTLVIRMAATGPIAIPQNLSITATGSPAPVDWTATPSDDAPWISVNARAGTTPATVRVGLVDWRAEIQAPGTYSGAITFTSASLPPVTVKVLWVVVPRLPGPT